MLTLALPGTFPFPTLCLTDFMSVARSQHRLSPTTRTRPGSPGAHSHGVLNFYSTTEHKWLLQPHLNGYLSVSQTMAEALYVPSECAIPFREAVLHPRDKLK